MSTIVNSDLQIQPSHRYEITDSEMSALLSILEDRASFILNRKKYTEITEHDLERIKNLHGRLSKEFFNYEDEH